MIYTITFNPSLDYHLKVKEFKLGSTNRAQEISWQVGGKGINNAIILKRLGFDVKVTGFLGHQNNQLILNKLTTEKLENKLITVKGSVRYNVKIHEKEQTEINAIGPLVTNDHFEKLLKIFQNCKTEDIVIISGSLAQGIVLTHLKNLLKLLNDRQIRFIVDLSEKTLIASFGYRPWLIKPNLSELETIIGHKLKNLSQIKKAAYFIQKKGPANLLISLGQEGAIFLNQTQEIFKISSPKGKVINCVGAGDSMLGAFVGSYLIKKDDLETSLKIASAAGSATCFGKELATKEKIFKLVKQIKVKHI